jgi:hypothetical protein
MSIDAEALLRLISRHAAEAHVPVPVSLATVRTIVAEADRLTAGRTENEPAALFYACARHARLFGRVGGSILDSVGGAQAMILGFTLDATEVDIVLLRGRIAFDAVGWEEVRDTFAGWLRSKGVPPQPKPSPRKRPR